MSLENNILNSEGENKKNILTNKEKELELKKSIEFKIKKEKIWVEIESENEVFKLKELIEKWIITNETAQKIILWEEISNDEIKEIFEKINQIEEIKDIDKYLPKEYRITSEQYLKAVNDDIYRVQILTKLDYALTILVKQIVPDSSNWLNLFSGFIWVLDKNLILIQENTIDIKSWLKKIEDQKNPKHNEKLSLWKKFLNFIKELY